MNVTTTQARKYVLLSVFGLLAIAAYKGNLADSQVSFSKRLWGTGVLAIMLGLAADVAPQIAGPFAVLVLVGSFTNGGDKAIQNALGKIGGTGTTAAASTSTTKEKPTATTPQAKSPQTNP